jgi:uncharacterized protein YjbJ (UPF0337 family)
VAAAIVGAYRKLPQENHMGINKDQVEGRVKEAAGKVQEVAGRTVGSATQEAKGMTNKIGGAAQAKYGDAKETVKENIKEAHKESAKESAKDAHKHG